MYKTEKNKIEIVVGNIANMKGDVVINWATSSLSHGNKEFYELHKVAGPLLRETMILAKDKLMEGDAFTSITGFLNYYKVINVIIPAESKDYNTSFRNIISTIETYKSDNVCRTVYISLPDNFSTFKNFVDNFFLYESSLNGLTFIFVVENEKELSVIQELIIPRSKYTNNLLTKLDTYIKTFVKRFNGNKQKKLSKGT